MSDCCTRNVIASLIFCTRTSFTLVLSFVVMFTSSSAIFKATQLRTTCSLRALLSRRSSRTNSLRGCTCGRASRRLEPRFQRTSRSTWRWRNWAVRSQGTVSDCIFQQTTVAKQKQQHPSLFALSFQMKKPLKPSQALTSSASSTNTCSSRTPWRKFDVTSCSCLVPPEKCLPSFQHVRVHNLPYLDLGNFECTR